MKKAIAISLVALLVNSIGVFVSAQTLPVAKEKDFPAAYDASVVKTIAMFPDLPGIAIVVIKDEKPIFLRAYGMADKETGIKADIDTLYYIASSTKSFTALAAAVFSVASYAQESIKIGVISDRIGVSKPYSEPATEGLIFGANEINRKGGVLGRKIELLIEDDQSRPDISAALARKLVDQGAVFILSVSLSPATQQQQTVTMEAKVPQMYSAIQTGQAMGMQTLDQNLSELVKRNQISPAEARSKAKIPENFPG